MAVKKQHERVRAVCNTCKHPINTKGHEDMTLAVKHYGLKDDKSKLKGRGKMIRIPCAACIKEGRRKP